MGFLNFSTSTWDIAAGDVLVRSLGGRVTDLEGNAIDYESGSSSTSVISSTDINVHEELLSLISNSSA